MIWGIGTLVLFTSVKVALLWASTLTLWDTSKDIGYFLSTPSPSKAQGGGNRDILILTPLTFTDRIKYFIVILQKSAENLVNI